MTPFARILQRAVEATPGAIGGAFAASDGEMVDSFAASYDAQEWAILTAHYGVVLAQLHAAFGTWHFGFPEYFIAQHATLDVVVHAVEAGYYALIAVTEPAPLATALSTLRTAAAELRREMA
ncbi:MAG: hypothetical protein AB7O24_21810 [Kofleriaceae bacterium]